MNSLNSVILIGTAGADPVSRQTRAGNLVAELSVASPHTLRTPSGTRTHTEWVRVRALGAVAALCQQAIRKGSLLAVQGRVRCRLWTDRGGQLHKEQFVQADELRVLDQPSVPHRRSAERAHPAFVEEPAVAIRPVPPPEAQAS